MTIILEQHGIMVCKQIILLKKLMLIGSQESKSSPYAGTNVMLVSPKLKYVMHIDLICCLTLEYHSRLRSDLK